MLRRAKQLFERRGPEAFTEHRINEDLELELTQRCVAVRPGFRFTSRRILYGVELTLERTLDDGKKVNLLILLPSHSVPRDRSKYMPHQGKREIARRCLGGFAFQRRSFKEFEHAIAATHTQENT